MPWLVVLGRGSWIRRGRDGGLKRYRAGVHEVDQEVADAARAASARIRSLVVLDNEPALERDKEGPITMEDLRSSRNWGVALASVAAGETSEPVEPRDEYDYECRLCPPGKSKFASPGRLTRHVEFHH